MTEIVPSELRGRVYGAVRAGAWAAIPLGILLGGALVATAGVAATFLVMGVLLAAVVAYGFFNPAFREMDRRPEAASYESIGRHVVDEPEALACLRARAAPER